MVIQAKKVVRSILDRAKYQREFADYYDGKQPLTFTTRKYRDVFAEMVAKYQENMCPAVVDALTERLEILGLEVEGSDNNAAGKKLWKIWDANRMQGKSQTVHQKALISGNGYVMVWPDAEGKPTIVPQYSDDFMVHYSEETNEIDWAAKLWQEDTGYVRLTIYEPTITTRFISSTIPAAGSDWSNLEYRIYSIDGTLPNPYGRVPVFHFANNAPKGIFGVSELKDVIPIQDALNKSVADLLVTMEYSAYGQRWATGIDIEESDDGIARPPFKPGQDRVWATANDNAKFGEFTASELSQFTNVHDMFLMNVARVSNTPMHYMLITSSVFPSGEALKNAEQRFISKVKNRQLYFGEVWEDVMTFCAQIARISLSDRVDVKWSLPYPRSELDFATLATMKKGFGVSDEQLMREAGYTEAQIEQIVKENKAKIPPALTQPKTPDNRVPNDNRLREAE